MARHLSRIVPTRDFNFKNKREADDLATRNASELTSPVALGETCSPVQTPPFTRASPSFCTQPFEYCWLTRDHTVTSVHVGGGEASGLTVLSHLGVTVYNYQVRA